MFYCALLIGHSGVEKANNRDRISSGSRVKISSCIYRVYLNSIEEFVISHFSFLNCLT